KNVKSERQLQILDVAKRLFLHHGFQKVTLGDIANEAGVSRPTVYQAFPNKEEIFKALIEVYQEESLERIQQLRDKKSSARGKIEEAVEIWIIETFEILHSSPEAREMLDCTFGFAAETTDAGYVAFESEITTFLDEEKFSGRLSNRELAHFLVVSMRGFKGQAEDVAELRKLIGNLLALAFE
ncbi:MAG: TetR/AcrR family transcriptional regulator, partial [Verrucomicrobiota bacterium]